MTFSRKVTCPYCGAVDRIPAEEFSDALQCASCGRPMFAARPVELTGAQKRVLKEIRADLKRGAQMKHNNCIKFVTFTLFTPPDPLPRTAYARR